jgi:hypothetical protein
MFVYQPIKLSAYGYLYSVESQYHFFTDFILS